MPFFLFQLETSEEFEQISTAEERESFKEKLDEVRNFFFLGPNQNACGHIAVTRYFLT